MGEPSVAEYELEMSQQITCSDEVPCPQRPSCLLGHPQPKIPRFFTGEILSKRF